MSAECEVSLVRGGLVESVHEVAVVVVGRRRAASSPRRRAQPRCPCSCAPPRSRSRPSRRCARACWSGSASTTATSPWPAPRTSGEPEHVALAAELLAAAGLDAGAICECGPGDDGRVRSRHMCSGNHALGLALCVCEGWPTAGYLEPAHPLQVDDARGARRRLAGAVPEEAGRRLRHARLPAPARAATRRVFGALGSATGALGRCAAAMRAHPDLVRGAGEIDTELMRAEPGARREGAARRRRSASACADGRGLALKVRDGAWRAMEPAAVHARRAAFGVACGRRGLERHAAPPIATTRGEVVGALRIPHRTHA